MTNPPVTRGFFKRRALALIATGSILGLGATAVLANWTDIERAFGEFGTSTFELEGAALQTDGSWATYASHSGAGEELAANLNFGNAATKVHPGLVVGTKYRVRLSAATTEPGAVSVQPADFSTNPLASFITTTTVVSDATAACDETTLAQPGLVNVNGVTPGQAIAPTEEQTYCVLVQFNGTNANGESLPQGVAANLNNVTWDFTAVSNDPVA